MNLKSRLVEQIMPESWQKTAINKQNMLEAVEEQQNSKGTWRNIAPCLKNGAKKRKSEYRQDTCKTTQTFSFKELIDK